MRFGRLAFYLLVVGAAAAQDKTPTFSAEVIAVNLNGGMKAELTSLRRDPRGFNGRPVLTAAVKITNPGKDYAFLLLYDKTSAVEDAGGVNYSGWREDAITGVEWCRIDPPERCFGVGNPAMAVPLASYTQIDPGNAVTVHLRLTTEAAESRGNTVSLSVKYGYRIVKAADMDKDADLPRRKKCVRCAGAI